MVKFSKQFEAELIPEWKESFVDYSKFKKELKRIELTDDQQLTDIEAASDFFGCLDNELNKVNQFYRDKENELLNRGQSLRNQMQILTDFNTTLSSSSSGLVTDEECRTTTEQEQRTMGSGPKQQAEKNEKKNLRLKESLTNPWQEAIGGASRRLHINRPKFRLAEKMIKKAFVELYRALDCLDTYRNLNILAFTKIMKKFEKVTNKQVRDISHKVVESSYFNSSDKVMKLKEEVEEIFIKHFVNGDRRKAMKYLKPIERKESHGLTFFIGLFTGTLMALLAGYIILAIFLGTYEQHSDTIYMETVYPIPSILGLIFLHFFLYGCNIFMWRKNRINHSYIFELKPAEELKYRDVFFICATSMTVVIGVLFFHLVLLYKGYPYSHIQPIISFLLLGFLLLLVYPFNILYKSARFRFLRVMRNICFSPLCKVVMLDFFLADQLCSQVPMLRNLEHLACYYVTGSYKNQDWQYCLMNKNNRNLAYIVSFLPYYWRAMQCARRWYDEGEATHLVNLGKYVSAMVAAGSKMAYDNEKNAGWLSLLLIASTVATFYQLYWDFVKDWGLLQSGSKNPWLRDNLILRRKWIYYLSMGLNLILRLAWLQSVVHYNLRNVDYRITELVLAGLEVIRRGQWNFYRLENEHITNAGRFRDVNTVPLPFND
ncbi:phosphate transporter PHO1-1-like [Impatiens glandulifera]|uniref:phosphate transporter PHO1-1-like n=1 Tax=Impatiens glandulifera TaxID=253017 RepID=UPI001FB13959|nr:phosphate transporter PHO1-1-like [Impatiens glandulifera]